MGTIRTAITLFDGVTDPLKRMHRAMGIVLNTFETMQRTSGRAVDTAAIRQAREEWARAGAGFDAVEQNIRDAEQAQQRLNDTVSEGASGVDNLVNKIKGIVTAYAGVEGMKKALDWTKTNLQMADTQRNAENQLRAVLANRGASEGSYDRLTANASAIQQAGMYGDEVMIGGTAELATYLKDTDALEHMMGTLTNYAAGMSGGGAVDYNQMVDYATQLGKALDGSYDGLKKKGFELSDAQKEIIENGTDMQKALVLDDVIGESWSNLYETMSNTPQGKIIQLENTWGDLQETMGNQLYPVVLHIVEAVTANWPKVETVMTSITGAVGRMVGVFGVLLNTGIHTANDSGRGGCVGNILWPTGGGKYHYCAEHGHSHGDSGCPDGACRRDKEADTGQSSRDCRTKWPEYCPVCLSDHLDHNGHCGNHCSILRSNRSRK